ncbi:MAG: hypothetical protein ACI8PZ_003312 [Myxococcota bacterium]|jgi:hypothetical protein
MIHLLLLLLACRGGDEEREPPEECVGDTIMVTEGQVVRTPGAGCGSIELTQSDVLGEGTMRLEWFTDGESVVPVITAQGAAVFEGLHARGSWSLPGMGEPVLWRQGWQSWSASGVFPLEAPEIVDGLPVAGGDDGTFEVVEETPGTSWWFGAVGRSAGPTLGVGVTSARVSSFYTSVAPGGDLHAVWGTRGERIPLADGEVLYLDALWAHFGKRPEVVVDRWSSVVADVARVSVRAEPPVGWSTWYELYAGVTEADVRANLARAEELRDEGVPIGVIQVDDGWAVAWGEWTANERFPSGMGVLASDIKAAGFTPGLWMAPFHVSRELPLAELHPEWFLHDRDGQLHVDNGYYVIDASHPDGREWMAEQVAARVDEGWTYLKLDFLLGGALNGERHQPMSGVTAYNLGMAAIRDAAGSAWILACGAPMLPTVGFADSWRSGPDVAFLAAPDPEIAFVRSQARSVAARSFTNGSWWWVDADPVLVRPPADEALARGAAVVVAVSGGAWFAGDDLDALDPARLEWALPSEVLALRGAGVRPVAPLASVSGFDTSPLIELAQPDDNIPTRWEWPSGEVALLNLSDAPLTLEGPGGVELLTGETAAPGPRTLAVGAGEIWRP